jgi:hypothetical protein
VNVQLSPATETLVRQLMESRGFESEEAAIADAVGARLGDEAYWTDLRDSIEQSQASIREGCGTLLTPNLGPRILLEARAHRDAKR